MDFPGMTFEIPPETVGTAAGLESNPQQLQDVMDLAQLGYWEYEAATGLFTFDDRFFKLYGTTAAREGGYRMSLDAYAREFVLAEDLPLVREKLTRTLRLDDPRRTCGVEHRIRRRDGALRHMLVRVAAPGDSFRETGRVHGVNQDVTELKQAGEDRMRMLSRAVEQCPASIVVTDTEGQIQYVNPTFSRVTGYGLEEVIGKNPRVLKSGRVPATEYRGLWENLKAGKDWEGEFCNLKKNGEMYWEHAVICPIKDEAGAVRHYMAIKEDITERRRAEEELRETNLQLEIASGRAQHMAIKAELASIAKSQFLANMSHEIRTPISGIIGMNELLLDTQLDADQIQYATATRDSARALLLLINDILDFSKIEAGKLELELLDLDPVSVVEGVVELLAASARSKDLVVDCIVDPRVSSCLCGDPGRLRQILMNLGGNAVKFTSRGEVFVEVSPEEDGPDYQVLRFQVHDSGIGIPKDRLDLLFSPFTQLDGSTARKFGGTGLGLAISKHLAQLMKGNVGVESEEGKGSTFWFTAQFEKRLGTRPAEEKLHETLRATRVLIVSSRTSSLRALVAGFKRWKIESAAFDHSTAAWEYLQREPEMAGLFSALVIDELDSDGEGEGLSKLLALAVLRTVPVIEICRSRSSSKARPFLGERPCASVARPFHFKHLVELLSSLLRPNPVDSAVSQPILPTPAPAELGVPGRVLLVDDDPTNRTIGAKLLERFNCRPTCVSGGQEAIELLASEQFDLVFMDCQMPGMDGLEATRRIREGAAGKQNASIPVIAMTARAMKGDREQCLAAGMNDYLSKPVDRAELGRAVKRWLTRNEPGRLPSPEPVSRTEQLLSASPAVSRSVPVLDYADIVSRLGNDPELAAQLALTLHEDLPIQISRLEEAVSRRQTELAGDLAHRIKGATGSVGGRALHDVAAIMESAGKAGDLVALESGLLQLQDEARRLMNALENTDWKGQFARLGSGDSA
jgi:PAS domain S-box-containing protein